MKRTHFILFALLIAGCSSSSIIAKSSDHLNGPYQRIFVVINSSYRAEKFIKAFTSNVKEEFDQRNITSEILIKTDTAREISQKIVDFNPDAILIIDQTAGVAYNIGNGGSSNGATFDLKLYDKTPDNLAWKGSLKVFGDFGISTATTKATNYFIARLEYDKIITKL
ncbi:MAG TPA: hypothetical protein VL832_22460 [Puia sp.]|jgi:hypothetical protein|nr:hypothetical protein [Puia sp.]